MEHPAYFKERRKHPRFAVSLPLEYQEMYNARPKGGLVTNVSEKGMLICSTKDMLIGSEFKVVVFYSNEFEFDGIEIAAKILWKDVRYEEEWKGYKYGLQFIQILEQDRRKLLNLLHSPLLSEGISVRGSTLLTELLPERPISPPPSPHLEVRREKEEIKNGLWKRLKAKLFRLS
jgi:PilZ domain